MKVVVSRRYTLTLDLGEKELRELITAMNLGASKIKATDTAAVILRMVASEMYSQTRALMDDEEEEEDR